MKADRELQRKILGALEWEPGVDAELIGVSVDDGVATLQGIVSTSRQKWLAERAVRRVYGVRAVANDLEVAGADAVTTDSAIAQAVANALEWDSAVPDGAVNATVRHGWVTLGGAVQWHYQKSAAERAVQRLTGVKGVNNSIVVKPQVSPADIRTAIEDALRRGAALDAQQIHVETRDTRVILTGTVHSRIERDEAERAAWAAPGVTDVDDRIVVAP